MEHWSYDPPTALLSDKSNLDLSVPITKLVPFPIIVVNGVQYSVTSGTSVGPRKSPSKGRPEATLKPVSSVENVINLRITP